MKLTRRTAVTIALALGTATPWALAQDKGKESIAGKAQATRSAQAAQPAKAAATPAVRPAAATAQATQATPAATTSRPAADSDTPLSRGKSKSNCYGSGGSDA